MKIKYIVTPLIYNNNKDAPFNFIELMLTPHLRIPLYMMIKQHSFINKSTFPLVVTARIQDEGDFRLRTVCA